MKTPRAVLAALLLGLAALPARAQIGGEDPALEGRVAAVVPAEAKVGETVTVRVEVTVPETFHIYSIVRSEGGIPTAFAVAKGPFRVGAGVKEPKPLHHEKQIEGSDYVEKYDYHEGTVAFEVPLEVTGEAQPGEVAFTIGVSHMLCTDEMCLPEAVLEVSGKVKVVAGGVAPPAADGKKAGPAPPAAAPPAQDASFLGMLGLAFLGGMLLNVMPCVLPVLTLKLFSLVSQKNVAPAERRFGAIGYTAGVMVCLNAFALAVVVLRSLGSQVGWGFQFQSPAFVIGLATVIFVFSLSLMGVFEVPAMGTGMASQASRQHGFLGYFLTGLFVTIVATPCSAPFLGTGLGFAFTLPGWGVFLFLSAAGLGLAFPFLVIGFVPALFRFMPRPGAWLEPFKKIMGFILIATSVWLMDTIATLTGTAGLIGFLAFLTAASCGAWIYGAWGSEIASPRSRIVSVAVAIVLTAAAGKFFLVTKVAEAAAAGEAFRTEGLDYGSHIPWQPFSEQNVATLRERRKPGFIDFTADW